jgi:hypothetical protein
MEDFRKHIKAEKDSWLLNKTVSYCGVDLSMLWHFEDIDHAVMTRQSKSYQLICPECRKIIIDLLNNEE